MKVTYAEVFSRKAIISAVPLKVGSGKLSDLMQAKVIILRVQFDNLIKKFEEDMQEVLKGLKESYPGFDSLAAEIGKMEDIDKRKEALKNWDKKGEKPIAPTKEELEEAEKIRLKKPDFDEQNEKLSSAYSTARNEQLSSEVDLTQKTLNDNELSQIIAILAGEEEISLGGIKVPKDEFLNALTYYFID